MSVAFVRHREPLTQPESPYAGIKVSHDVEDDGVCDCRWTLNGIRYNAVCASPNARRYESILFVEHCDVATTGIRVLQS